MYGLDGPATWPVDGVQAITRVPLIFEYLYTHFRLRSAHKYGSGWYLLSPRRVPRTRGVIPVPLRAVAHGTTLATAVLRQPTSCGLVRLTLEARYPLTRLLGRTDGLVLAFWKGRRFVEASNAVPLETGGSFTTYVSLLPPEAFYHVYDDWLPTGPRWDRLTLGAADSGLFGVAPVDLGVRQVACMQG